MISGSGAVVWSPLSGILQDTLSHAHIPLQLLLLCNSPRLFGFFFPSTWQLSLGNVTSPAHYLLTYYPTVCDRAAARGHTTRNVTARRGGRVCCHPMRQFVLHHNVSDGLFRLWVVVVDGPTPTSATVRSSWCRFTLKGVFRACLLCSSCKVWHTLK